MGRLSDDIDRILSYWQHFFPFLMVFHIAVKCQSSFSDFLSMSSPVYSIFDHGGGLFSRLSELLIENQILSCSPG